MSVEFGTHFKIGASIGYIADSARAVRLLYPVVEIPAPEINAMDQLHDVLGTASEYLFAELKDHHTIIACSHGVNWGLEPEKILVDQLAQRGIKVFRYRGDPVFPKVGGRNRIQTHGILLLPTF